MGSVEATDEGQAVVLAFLVPIPFVPTTQANACRKLADIIAPVIGSSEPSAR
jgi:hypothetical protein